MSIAIDIKAKFMKLLIIAVLMLFSLQSYALEFHRCVDEKGRQHFTNLPAQTLDANCKLKTDQYSYMFNQDYSKLENLYKEWVEPVIPEQPAVESPEQTNDSTLPVNGIVKPILDIDDPGNVIDSANKRKNEMDSILKEEQTDALVDDS